MNFASQKDKMMSAVSVFTAFLLAITHGGYCLHNATSGESYTHKAVLSENVFELFWKYDSSKITFEVEVATTGWVGFGLSPNGGMAGSDIVIGGVHGDGRWYFTDRHAAGKTEPSVDDSQDYVLLHSSQNQIMTTLRFSRKLDTCDNDDMIINGDTFRIIWAYGESDTVLYHSASPLRRGVKSVLLLAASRSLPTMPSDAITWDFVVNNVSVPSTDTTYWCKGYNVPQLSKKHHVIKYEPYVTPGNEAVVHHIVVYACYGDVNTTGAHLYEAEKCEYMPNNIAPSCMSSLFAWAVGGETFYYPENTGLPFGDDQQPKFLLLEIHYDNPSRRADWIDSSGLKLTLTPTLRADDAGMLIVGPSIHEGQMIPPGQSSFTTYGYCNSECTKEGLAKNPNGIKIFAGMLHAHLLGRKLRLRHIRNGKELEPMFEDNNYDFNYQEMVTRRSEASLLAGDEMQMECNLNSQGRTNITRGGLATDDEMCLVFLLYYPRTQLTGCYSYTPGYKPYLKEKKIDYTEIDHNDVKITSGQYAGQKASVAFEKFTWNEENARLLESTTKESSYAAVCMIGGTFLNMTKPWGTYPAPLTISTPYRPPARQCVQRTATTPGAVNVGVSSLATLTLLIHAVLACLVIGF